MPLDVGRLLSRIAEVVGKGAFEQHQTETMGGDWRLKIEQLKAQRDAQARAKELHGFQVRDQQAEEDARTQAQDARTLIAKNTEGLGGDSPSDAGPVPLNLSDAQLRARLTAKQAMEGADLERRQSEADIRAKEATATYTEARPGIESEKADQRERALDVRIAAAEAAGNRAEAAALQGERRLLLQEREENRRQTEQDEKARLSEGTMAALQGLGEGYRNATRLQTMLQDPKASSMLGPLRGRAWTQAIQLLGGAGASPEQKRLAIELEAALSGRAFAQGGKALTQTELERFQREMPALSDTLEMALEKVGRAREILKNSAQIRYMMLAPSQKRQVHGALPIMGFDARDGFASTDDVDGMPPTPQGATPNAPTVPGTPSSTQSTGKRRMRWDGTKMVPVS